MKKGGLDYTKINGNLIEEFAERALKLSQSMANIDKDVRNIVYTKENIRKKYTFISASEKEVANTIASLQGLLTEMTALSTMTLNVKINIRTAAE